MTLPDIVHHVDGEDGPTIGFHVEFPDGRWIWCGELTNARADEINADTREELNLTNGGGWFLETGKGHEKTLLGRIAGEDQAREVVSAMRTAMSQQPST
jgi:hypothetical protein